MAWIIHSGVAADEWAPDPSQEVKWFIFLTNWAYFTLTTSTLVDAMVVLYVRLKRRDIIKGENIEDITRGVIFIRNLSNEPSVSLA